MPRQLSSKFILLLLAGLTAGCDPEPARTVDPSVAVRNSGPLPDTMILVPEWTRSLPELGDERIAGLAAGARGGLWVASRGGEIVGIAGDSAPAVHLTPPVNREAPEVVALAADSLGVLWLRDASTGTVVRVRADGAWVSEARAGAGPLLWGRRALATDARGRIWAGLHPPEEGTWADNLARPVYARLEDGMLVDTLRIPTPVSEDCAPTRDPHFRSGWLEDFRERYLPFPQWTLLSSGSLVAGCPNTYAFHMGTPSIDRNLQNAPPLTRVEVESWTPVPVGTAEREDVTLTWTTMMRTRDRPGAGTWTWEGDSIPATKPAYGSLLVGHHGNIWVWTAEPSTTVPSNPTWPLAGLPEVLWVESGSGTFDVFGPDGRLRFHVRVPPELRYTSTPDTPELMIRGDTLWAVADGSDGDSVITRYLVTPR